MAGIIAIDFVKGRFGKSSDWKLFCAAILAQTMYTSNLIQTKISSQYSDLYAGSLFQICAVGLIPILAMTFAGLIRPKTSKFKDLPWTLIGGILAVAVNLPLAFTPIAALNTESNYGSLDASYSSIHAFRIALPGFPGVISGGVFSGIIAIGSFAYLLKEKKRLRRIIAVFAFFMGLTLVWLTETRSAGLIIVFLIPVLIFDGLRKAAKCPLITATCLILLPLLMPIVYPKFIAGLSTPDFIQSHLTRQGGNIWMLGARVDLWEGFLDANWGAFPVLSGFGPFGEYISGMNSSFSGQDVAQGIRSVDILHAHNLFLNIFYSNGIIGVVIVGWFLWILNYRLLTAIQKDKSAATYATAVVMIALCLEGIVESLFFQNYQYFLPFCVLLTVEYLLKTNRHPAHEQPSHTNRISTSCN
jgi:hypothetical protein